MNFIYIATFFLISFVVSGQSITGNVSDNFLTPVSFANVQLIEVNSNKIISFTQTDSKGNYSLTLENISFPLKVKVSHLSYEPKEFILHSFSEEKLNFTLELRANKIEDVIIETRAYDVIERNELVVDIYIKAVRSSEFIIVNFNNTRLSQSFTELVG